MRVTGAPVVSIYKKKCHGPRTRATQEKKRVDVDIDDRTFAGWTQRRLKYFAVYRDRDLRPPGWPASAGHDMDFQ